MKSSRFRAMIAALRFVILPLLIAAILLPSALRADTITYDLASTDTLTTGSISGSFTVNTATGFVNGTIVADGLTFTCSNCALSNPGGQPTLEGFEALGSGGSYVFLSWLIASPLPNPLTFNSSYSFCAGCTAGLDYVSANDTASVPEPSTALLLISGLAALPFVRRLRAKA
jgi:hypothetical protein